MEVEYTARQVKISKALRMQAEEGMERIARILGKNANASIVFSTQKRLQIAELTIKARMQTIAAEGKADTLESALRQAIEHAENQARRHRDRRMASKRLPKEEKMHAAPPVVRPKARAAQPEDGAEEVKPVRSGAKASADRCSLVPGPQSGRRTARRFQWRGFFLEAHDHRGSRQGCRVPRPRPAGLPQSIGRTVCAPPPSRRPDGASRDSLNTLMPHQADSSAHSCASPCGGRRDGRTFPSACMASEQSAKAAVRCRMCA